MGGELDLITDRGLISFPIAGVFYDYSSSQGSALFSQSVYQSYWSDKNITALSLILEPGVDVDLTAQELREDLAGGQKLLIRPNQAIRQETLQIFERTFTITASLQIMTTLVAFVGILSALMTLQMDKKRQIGVLRSSGFDRKTIVDFGDAGNRINGDSGWVDRFTDRVCPLTNFDLYHQQALVWLDASNEFECKSLCAGSSIGNCCFPIGRDNTHLANTKTKSS